MATKASEWAEHRKHVDTAGTFYNSNEDPALIAWVDDDGNLEFAMDPNVLPVSDVPRFIAWLQEWFTEEVTNG